MSECGPCPACARGTCLPYPSLILSDCVELFGRQMQQREVHTRLGRVVWRLTHLDCSLDLV